MWKNIFKANVFLSLLSSDFMPVWLRTYESSDSFWLKTSLGLHAICSSWSCVAGLHARSPPGQAQLWLLWDRLLITESFPSTSTVSGSWPVGWSEHKETLCLSRPQQSSMLLQNSHDLVKIITDPSFQRGRWRYCSNSELLFITSLLLASGEPA